MKGTSMLTRFAEAKDPLDIDEYSRLGGFSGLSAALKMPAAAVIETVRRARLAGRGGAGFDAGTKWSTVVEDAENVYVVCNADEGEPGTFKDRYLLENAPYLVIEGLAIAAYAVGAEKAFVYVRGEYPVAAERLRTALSRVRDRGLLSKRNGDSSFTVDVSIKTGGGSYVVGDETALLSSLMGNRGYPMLKPPFPTEEGLWKEPTVVNNVETLACVPLILGNGPDWFRTVGTEANPGPKLFSVSGHVSEPGVYEFPMGVSLAEVLEAAGGVEGTLKAVQIGGTAGPIYPAARTDLRLDYASMREAGGSLGSGALVVMNTTVSMIHVLQLSMRFFSEESCGQCFACRYGTRQLEYMANELAAGRGTVDYLARMRETVDVMDQASFCPFGQSVRFPVMSILDNFGDELTRTITEHEYIQEVG